MYKSRPTKIEIRLQGHLTLKMRVHQPHCERGKYKQRRQLNRPRRVTYLFYREDLQVLVPRYLDIYKNDIERVKSFARELYKFCFISEFVAILPYFKKFKGKNNPFVQITENKVQCIQCEPYICYGDKPFCLFRRYLDEGENPVYMFARMKKQYIKNARRLIELYADTYQVPRVLSELIWDYFLEAELAEGIELASRSLYSGQIDYIYEIQKELVIPFRVSTFRCFWNALYPLMSDSRPYDAQNLFGIIAWLYETEVCSLFKYAEIVKLTFTSHKHRMLRAICWCDTTFVQRPCMNLWELMVALQLLPEYNQKIWLAEK